MKTLITILFIGMCSMSISQNLNGYKYVVVPETFEAFKKPNEFRLNVTLQGILSKYGFKAFLTKKNLPDDGLNNSCSVLTAELIKNSSLFVTKLAIQLINCKDEVVYTSEYGNSREKKYIVAYNNSLREAGKYLSVLNYEYDESKKITGTSNYPEASTVLKAETDTVKKEKEALLNINSTLVNIENQDPINDGLKQGVVPTKFYAELRQKEGWVDYNIMDAKGVLYFIFYSTGQKDTYLVQESNNEDKMLCFKKEGLWNLVVRNETKMEIKILQIQF